MKKNDEFSKGFACAVATLVKHEGGTCTAAEELYRCNFLTEKQLREIGADEGDIKTLLPVIANIRR